MTGVELALFVLTVIMVGVGGVIWARTRAWQWVACWVAVVIGVAYELHLVG